MHTVSTLRAGLALLVIGCSATAFGQAAEPGRRTAPAAAAQQDDQDFVTYELRAGEDPSKVARMFHVTLDELLALNHIADPRRLSVGAMLKIPDPRAALVAELRAEKDGLQKQ